MTLLSQIYTRGARAWSKFDVYLEIILSFAIHSAEDIEGDTDSYRSASHDPQGEAYKVGIEFFF
jgi:hypothetical protein